MKNALKQVRVASAHTVKRPRNLRKMYGMHLLGRKENPSKALSIRKNNSIKPNSIVLTISTMRNRCLSRYRNSCRNKKLILR